MTMSRSSLAVISLILLATKAAAEPLLLLMNAQAKCMSVEAPADAILNIEYEAPDLVEQPPQGDGEPRDPRRNRRFRTTITITQDGSRANHHGRNRHKNDRNRDRPADGQKGGKVARDLDTKKGSIEFVTSVDGKVSICVQSLTASSISPTPISLRVTESPAGEESVGPPLEKTLPGEKLDSASQQNAVEHFSQMEKTLSNLISKTEMILRQADYAKELEVEFHEQSIAMNRASQWWPIVQLCVLLVTGFTQANHMVQFFRKHHIF